MSFNLTSLPIFPVLNATNEIIYDTLNLSYISSHSTNVYITPNTDVYTIFRYQKVDIISTPIIIVPLRILSIILNFLTFSYK